MNLHFCRLQEEREKLAQLRGPPDIDPEEAATKIQKVSKVILHRHVNGTLLHEIVAPILLDIKGLTFVVYSQTWRGVYQRKQIAKMRQDELLFIGMVRYLALVPT